MQDILMRKKGISVKEISEFTGRTRQI
ncbi:hypothetical protein LCGC14_2740110, partial [marine sediment metagenome]